MNFFVVALSLVAICSVTATTTNHEKQKAEKIIRDCTIELGYTLDELPGTKTLEDGETLQVQNFAKCYFKKDGIYDDNGDFQESVAIAKLVNYGVTEKNVKQCIATAGDSKANAFAFEVTACCHEFLKAKQVIVSS